MVIVVSVVGMSGYPAKRVNILKYVRNARARTGTVLAKSEK
jgi:hypothetical protein